MYTKFVFLLLLTFASFRLSSQRLVEKRMSVPSSAIISVDVQTAENIHIVTWEKNEMLAKASISINDNQDNDLYEVNFTGNADTVGIQAKFLHNGIYSDKTIRIRNVEIHWTIYIPANSPLQVNTINGNIFYTGKSGPTKLNSISGDLDLTIDEKSSSSFDVHTVTGTLFTDLTMDPEKKNSHSSNFCLKYNGGGNNVALKTVSGNIYLRKAGTQL